MNPNMTSMAPGVPLAALAIDLPDWADPVRLSRKPAAVGTILARWFYWLALLLFEMISLIVVGEEPCWQSTWPRWVRMPVDSDGIGFLIRQWCSYWVPVTLFPSPYMPGEEGEEKYYALLPLWSDALSGLGFAMTSFNLWVWFETMAITSYLLVAFYRDNGALVEAGVKYLVQSAVGSVLVLMGIAHGLLNGTHL